MDKKYNIEDFIRESNLKHNNKYDYSKVFFINKTTKVCIICPKHGIFYMTPHNHIIGQGCPKCKGKGLTQEEIIEKANIIHNNKYDYSKVVFKKMHEKVTIICPIHGAFEQTLSKHISKKQGCPKCGAIKRSTEKLMKSQDFFDKANIVHNNKYDYSKSSYQGMNKMFTYICPIHGENTQRPFDHLRGFGCIKCANLISKKENNIFDFISSHFTDTQHNNRSILNKKELDVYIPSKNVAIEYNGLRWHSELFGKDKWYHLNKTLECNSKGVKLLQIFEDEFINNQEIVLNKIKHILNIDTTNKLKVYGRKCNVEVIDKEIASKFLDEFHIQGYAPSTLYLGASYEDKLIAVMSFKQETKGSDNWELTRFASDYHFICCGVGGKLFNYFIKNYNPSKIKSFADRRWTLDKDNNLYTKLGFTLEKELEPDYEYVLASNPTKRNHKFNFRKQILHKKYGLPLTMTETEMVKELGYCKIWNCGLFKFIWEKDEERRDY